MKEMLKPVWPSQGPRGHEIMEIVYLGMMEFSIVFYPKPVTVVLPFQPLL